MEAMKKSFGNVSASARAVGISRATPYVWAKADKKFADELQSNEYAEAYKDAIEQKLAKLALTDENPTVLIFLAKTKAKDRGYVERTELTGKDGETLNNTMRVDVIYHPSQVQQEQQEGPDNELTEP